MYNFLFTHTHTPYIYVLLRDTNLSYLKRGPYTIKKSVNILKQKIDIKILTGFLTVCGRFFCQKIHRLKILTDQICLIYFDQSSIFWQLFNILTRVWAPVKILIKNLVLRWTFSKNQSYGNGSIRIKHFQHNEFWSKFWWNVCGQYGVKNLIKNWKSIFCFKILTVFLIVYGALNECMCACHYATSS